jgi:hypothetical protein
MTAPSAPCAVRPGYKTLLMGPTGVGKTYSIRTYLARPEIEHVFVVFTEPAMNVLVDTDPERLHWRYVPGTRAGLDTLRAVAKLAHAMNTEDFQKLHGIEKARFNQLEELYKTLEAPACDRTGKKFPTVTDWDPSFALVVDGLSGLNTAFRTNHLGAKPCPHQGEWGTIMNMEEMFIKLLAMELNCFATLIAHNNREMTPAGVINLPVALGSKLAPVIGREFNDVILAQRDGAKFTWSTASTGADLKAQNLPIRSELEPSFAPLVEGYWKQRGKKI